MRISDWSSDVCSSDLDVTAQLGRNDDRSENSFDDHAGGRTRVGHFYTSRKTASLQADFRLDARNLLSAGADWQRDAVESDTEFDVTRRDNTGVFAEYQGSLDRKSTRLNSSH